MTPLMTSLKMVISRLQSDDVYLQANGAFTSLMTSLITSRMMSRMASLRTSLVASLVVTGD